MTNLSLCKQTLRCLLSFRSCSQWGILHGFWDSSISGDKALDMGRTISELGGSLNPPSHLLLICKRVQTCKKGTNKWTTGGLFLLLYNVFMYLSDHQSDDVDLCTWSFWGSRDTIIVWWQLAKIIKRNTINLGVNERTYENFKNKYLTANRHALSSITV